MQISGSSAIVVGRAGGLGDATARRLRAEGAQVVIADLADEKGRMLRKTLGVRYMRTDTPCEYDASGAIAEAESPGPLRISDDAHSGPAGAADWFLRRAHLWTQQASRRLSSRRRSAV